MQKNCWKFFLISFLCSLEMFYVAQLKWMHMRRRYVCIRITTHILSAPDKALTLEVLALRWVVKNICFMKFNWSMPAKTILSWSAIVYRDCELITLLSVTFCYFLLLSVTFCLLAYVNEYVSKLVLTFSNLASHI